MTNSTQHWIEKAQYDLGTANAMLDTGRYLYVLFCCQQAIEKALKAIISERTNEMPPRSHNLARLAELAFVDMSKDQMEFVNDLTTLYLKTRYPERMEKAAYEVNAQMADEAFNKMKEMFEWLSDLLYQK
ncbi:MAG: HEPN domain-containing protein [Candidatus Hatepunaea meridiana]|nr:HEPN domain-containing protein [Candidatus Hatepunaea meridiana]